MRCDVLYFQAYPIPGGAPLPHHQFPVRPQNTGFSFASAAPPDGVSSNDGRFFQDAQDNDSTASQPWARMQTRSRWFLITATMQALRSRNIATVQYVFRYTCRYRVAKAVLYSRRKHVHCLAFSRQVSASQDEIASVVPT